MATPETTPEEIQTAEDGQQGTQESQIDWEKRYKDTQAELTRVKQSKEQPQQDQGTDPEQVKNYLKELGFVSKDELERERQLNSILDSNPELKKNAKAIETIAKAENKAYEDVIEEYGFGSKDQLAKAKSRGPMGDKVLETKSKSYKDLTPAEREARKKEQKNETLVRGKEIR